MSTDLKSKLATWLPQTLLIIALNFVYFYPVLQGKILNQNDILTGKIKGKEITDYREAHNDEPLWRNSMFAGMPDIHHFPKSIFTYVQPTFELLGKSGTYIIALFMLGVFFFARESKIDPWLSFLAAIAVGFSAFFIISVGAGHNAKVRTAAYIAPILMSVLMTYRGKFFLGLGLTSLFVGLSVFSNHIQITYYTFLVILAIIITHGVVAYKKKELPDFIKKSVFLALAACIGVGPSIGRLWSHYANMKETMRGGGSELTTDDQTNTDGLNYDYAMSWSYGIGETANLVFPYATGGGSKGDYSGTETYDQLLRAMKQQGYSTKQAEQAANQNAGSFLYWGDQTMVNGAYYMGAVVFFLFVFGMLTLSGTKRYWLIASLIISLLLGWGKNIEPLSKFFFNYLPFYDKFRVPSMAFTIILVLMPLIGFFGVNKLFNRTENQDFFKKKLVKALAISAGFGIVWLIIGTIGFSFGGVQDERFSQYIPLDTLIADRQDLFRSSIFTSILWMAAAFAVLFFYNKNVLKKGVFVGILGVLILADLWTFDKEQVNESDFISERKVQQMAQMTPADQQILQDPDVYYRVWNTTMPITGDYLTAYFHKSLGGIHASKLARYQDIIDHQISKGNQPTLDMLNTKYIIVENPQTGQKIAQRNPGALGNCWFVNSILPAKDGNQEMELITDFKPATQVVVHQDFSDYVAGLNLNAAGANIELTSYDNKEMVYRANVQNGTQLAVFSDIYYTPKNQAWRAYIDGEEVEHIRVNYLLRGLKVPAGEHEIKFVFHPKSYYMGGTIDLTFSIILLLVLGGSIFMYLKKKDEKTA